MICLQKSVCTRYDVEHISRKLLSLTRKLQERKALETIKVAIFAADAGIFEVWDEAITPLWRRNKVLRLLNIILTD